MNFQIDSETSHSDNYESQFTKKERISPSKFRNYVKERYNNIQAKYSANKKVEKSPQKYEKRDDNDNQSKAYIFAMKALQKQVEELERELEQIKGELDMNRQEIERWRHKCSSITNSNFSNEQTLMARVEEIKCELYDSKTQISTIKSENNELRMKLSVVEETKKKTEKRLEEERESFSKQINELQEKISHIFESGETREAELRQVVRDNKELVSARQSLEEEISSMEQSLQAQRETNYKNQEHYRAVLEEYERELSEFYSEKERLKGENSRLLALIEAERETNSTLNSRNDSLKKDLITLEGQLASANEIQSELEHKIRSLIHDLEKTEAQVAYLKGENENLGQSKMHFQSLLNNELKNSTVETKESLPREYEEVLAEIMATEKSILALNREYQSLTTIGNEVNS